MAEGLARPVIPKGIYRSRGAEPNTASMCGAAISRLGVITTMSAGLRPGWASKSDNS